MRSCFSVLQRNLHWNLAESIAPDSQVRGMLLSPSPAVIRISRSVMKCCYQTVHCHFIFCHFISYLLCYCDPNTWHLKTVSSLQKQRTLYYDSTHSRIVFSWMPLFPHFIFLKLPWKKNHCFALTKLKGLVIDKYRLQTQMNTVGEFRKN